MEIKETNLEFNALTKRKGTNRIIVHNSGVTVRQSVEIIHNYHKNTRGWAGIGYHFYVRTDGSIYRGRPEDTIGAHATGANSDSIGICFEGNYDEETMSDIQIKAGQELVAYLKSKYSISKVQRHSDVGKTSCPGTNFPFDEIVNGQTVEGNTTVPNSGQSTATTVTDNQAVKEQIGVDGKWGQETTRKAQKVFGTPVDGIVSNQYLVYKEKNKGLLASAFDWKEQPSKNGSVLIGAIQEKISVKKDGFIGPDTITGMQKWLGTTQDGYVSNPSEMVRAFQEWLNKQ